MPQPRTPLGQITGNVEKRKELTAFERGQVIGYYNGGMKCVAIATKMNMPNSTI